MKGKLSGTLTDGLVPKPEWGAIAVDAATQVDRPVPTVLAYSKSVSEWRDARDCALAAVRGWLSIRDGFASA